MKIEIRKSKDLHPQCNFCWGEEDVYEVVNLNTRCIISSCGKCVDKIQKTIQELDK